MPKHRTSGKATRSGKCDGKNKSLSLQFEICWLGMMKTDDFRWCFVVPQPKLVTVTSPGMNAISHESIVASHGRKVTSFGRNMALIARIVISPMRM